MIAGPLISVVIPVLGSERSFSRAIQSVLAQSHAHLELIVVPDSNADSVLVEVQALRDDRIHMLPPAKFDGCASSARNSGMQAANGDYVTFLGAADFWLPHKLETQLSAIENSSQAAASYGQIDRHFADGRRQVHTRGCPSGDLSALLREKNVVGNSSNMLVATDVAIASGGFPEQLHHAADWVFSLRLAALTQFVGIAQILSFHRDPTTITNTQLAEIARNYRDAQSLVRSELGNYSLAARRAGKARHYRYLARLVEEHGMSTRDTATGCYWLFMALMNTLGSARLKRSVGLRLKQLANVTRRLLRAERYWYARNKEYTNNGYIGETYELANTSPLPTLIEEARLFDSELERLNDAGFTHRVPYFVTPCIAELAQDQNILRVVRRLLPSTDAWVMWGANIRRAIPNAAHHWHVDTESFRWGSITVAVALDGCHTDSATWYLKGSHHAKILPPDGIDARDTEALRAGAESCGLSSDKVGSFSGLADGRFYVFDASGWHCGDPQASTSRVMLFLHYHSARSARIPAMDDYSENTWLPEAAAYMCEPGRESQLNLQLASSADIPSARTIRRKRSWARALP